MHIDVNSAFLSWTAVYLLNNGSKYDIRDSYAVIGGDEKSRRGIVLAASIKAKKQGVVTGETLYSARKKCKVLKSYSMNYPFYQEMSNKMFDLIKKYTPDIEITSIDECYIEYTNIKNMHGNEYEFALKLREEINKNLGITVNIGIANNKLCAKMASDFSKPNKIHTLYNNEIEEKMWPLPINDLFGIGKKTTEKLLKLNIKTIKDLALVDLYKLKPYFKNMASNMISSAQGINNDKVISEEVICKGISNEITLIKDINNKEKLYPYLNELASKVSLRIRKQQRYAYVIAVILKDKYFKRKTHQKKLVNPTNMSKEIFEFSKEILKEMWNDDEVRLVGIRLDTLVNKAYHQVSLFDNINIRENDQKLEKIVDDLQDKYGYKVIKYDIK